MQIYNTIYSASIVTNTSYEHTFTDCLSGAINKSETVAETNGFPNTTNGWTKKSKGTRFDLDGDRYIHVYEWDGTTSLGEVKKNISIAMSGKEEHSRLMTSKLCPNMGDSGVL